MSWALFIVGVTSACLTCNAYRPLYWPGGIALISFFPGWLVGELPIHTLIVHAATAAVLVSTGGLDDMHWSGVAGAALTAASCLGLYGLFRGALRTSQTVEAALVDGLGPRYRDEVVPHLREQFAARPSALHLARVLPIARPEVERTANIVYHTAGRRKLKLDVYRHKSRPTKAPTLLYVHGGGWVIGNKRQQGLVTIHHLAARGWTCVTMNYRLSPRATWPDHIHDVKRAIKWIREHGESHGADPEFIVIAGGSAGAHLASLAALTPNAIEYQREFPEVDTAVQACVGYYGVYDFADRQHHFRHGAFRRLLEMVIMKRSFASAPEEYDKASPLYRIGDHAPPFFLLHGDRDSLAPVAGARHFRSRLAEVSDQPVVYAELAGAQHAFEIFPSVRSANAVFAVERFCAHAYSRHVHHADTRDSRES